MKYLNAFKRKYTFFFANFFSGYYINLIGMISLTEIFILLKSPSIIVSVIRNKNQVIKFVSKLYLLLLIVQIISEIIIGNDFINATKGIMVTIMSFLLIIFYYNILKNDLILIKYAPLASIFSLLFFGDQFNYFETGASTYFKFYLAPILVSIFLYLIMTTKIKLTKLISVISLVLSLILIIGGARSVGFSLLLSSFIFILYYRFKLISKVRVYFGLLILIIVFQVFYAYIYIPNVINGNWGSEQNKTQLQNINYSSNSLSLILAARYDFFVSWEAFMDKPLWGHGAWAEDKDLKYFYLNNKYKDYSFYEREIVDMKLIPVHSVVVGMGTQHGILKFIVFLVLFIFMYKIALKSLSKNLPPSYNFFLIYLIISSFQHLLFGPPAILKSTGSIAFAIFIAFYSRKIKSDEKKIQVSRCNSNIHDNKISN